MATDSTTALNQVTALPVEDQIELLHQAWDRLIAQGWEPELTAAQMDELNRRVADLDANPNNTVSLEQLIKHVRRPR